MLGYLLSKHVDSKLDSAQRTIFREVLIIHYFEEEGLFERMYWRVDDLVPHRVKVYVQVSSHI